MHFNRHITIVWPINTELNFDKFHYIYWGNKQFINKHNFFKAKYHKVIASQMLLLDPLKNPLKKIFLHAKFQYNEQFIAIL